MRMRLNPTWDTPLGDPSFHPPKHAWNKVVHNDFIFGGDAPPAPAAPDYGPMSAASEKAAELGHQLGTAQLDESKRQYDQNMAVARPVVDAQLGIMNQTKSQGDDYYKYMTETFRPLEKRMVATADHEGSDARLEEMAGQAAADVRHGQSQQANMMARQGLRYGYSPAKMAAMAGQMATANASAQAGAMTGARNQQRNVGWARQMDAAGLGRGLPGASQGAYGLAVNAGSAGMGNQMAPGGQLLTGMAQGAGMQQHGMGQKITGLGGVLNAQTAYNNMLGQYNSSQNSGGGLGALLGAGAQIGSAMIMASDRRLKQNIKDVGTDAKTGLPLYEFSYIGDSAHRYRGVMSDDVRKVMPQAIEVRNGYDYVNYGMLGIQMVEV